MDMTLGVLQPHIDGVGVLNKDPRWQWDTGGYAGHPFLVWLITAGNGSLSVGSESFELHPGVCLLTALWLPHHGRQDPDKPLGIHWIRFFYVNGTKKQAVPNPMPKMCRQIGQVSFLRELIQRAIEAFDAGNAAVANNWMSAVLQEITSVDIAEARQKAEGEYYGAIRAVAEKIKEEPSRPWRIGDLCRPFDMTPDHFIRVFKRIMGQTPGEFVLAARTEAACRLLRFSAMSITEISNDLGFCDVQHFSRQFAARVGVTPSAFKKKG
jgi:AraC-like DNA-binding protein